MNERETVEWLRRKKSPRRCNSGAKDQTLRRRLKGSLVTCHGQRVGRGDVIPHRKKGPRANCSGAAKNHEGDKDVTGLGGKEDTEEVEDGRRRGNEKRESRLFQKHKI